MLVSKKYFTIYSCRLIKKFFRLQRIFWKIIYIILIILQYSCKDNEISIAVSNEGPLFSSSILFIAAKKDSNGHYGTYQLYEMNEDCSFIRQLTFNPNFPIHYACWSPDGLQIMFTSSVGGAFGYDDAIYTMNLNGSNIRSILRLVGHDSNPCTGRHPVWSPDAKQIAFSRIVGLESRGRRDIFLINIDGMNERQLTFSEDLSEDVYDWSRDGLYILGNVIDYVTRDSLGYLEPNARIKLFSLKGDCLWTWGKTGFTFGLPVYSTRGDRIAFISTKVGYQALYIMHLGGISDTLIASRDFTYYEPVSWSPNDKKILCNVGIFSSHERIIIIDIDSKHIQDVTPFYTGGVYAYAVSWRRQY